MSEKKSAKRERSFCFSFLMPRLWPKYWLAGWLAGWVIGMDRIIDLSYWLIYTFCFMFVLESDCCCCLFFCLCPGIMMNIAQNEPTNANFIQSWRENCIAMVQKCCVWLFECRLMAPTNARLLLVFAKPPPPLLLLMTAESSLLTAATAVALNMNSLLFIVVFSSWNAALFE